MGKRVGGWRSASLEVGGKGRTTREDGETETRRERQKTEDRGQRKVRIELIALR
jgi:hypothetical protein